MCFLVKGFAIVILWWLLWLLVVGFALVYGDFLVSVDDGC